jgi:hypothetical protein
MYESLLQICFCIEGIVCGGKNSNEIRPPTFVSSKASRPGLGPTQSPMQWVQGNLPPKLKRPGREADHLPPCSAEVKNYVTI